MAVGVGSGDGVAAGVGVTVGSGDGVAAGVGVTVGSGDGVAAGAGVPVGSGDGVAGVGVPAGGSDGVSAGPGVIVGSGDGVMVGSGIPANGGRRGSESPQAATSNTTNAVPVRHSLIGNGHSDSPVLGLAQVRLILPRNDGEDVMISDNYFCRLTTIRLASGNPPPCITSAEVMHGKRQAGSEVEEAIGGGQGPGGGRLQRMCVRNQA